MKKKHLLWIVPLILVIGFILGSILSADTIGYGAVVQLCHERGYNTPAHFERWNFNDTEIFSIYCMNDEGEFAITETFPVLNDVHTGLSNGGNS